MWPSPVLASGLYLSHSQTRMLHGQTRYNIKSRFFEEMPEHTLKWLTPQTGLAPAMWGAQGLQVLASQ